MPENTVHRESTGTKRSSIPVQNWAELRLFGRNRPSAKLLQTVMCLFVALILSACSSVRAPEDLVRNQDPNAPLWTGRIALTVESEPKQSFVAEFDLEGNAQAGEMQFYTRLGTTLAQARWAKGGAQLTLPQKSPYSFASLEALTQKLLGTALPLNMVFAWASGQDAQMQVPENWRVISQTRETSLAPAELVAVKETGYPTTHLHLWLQSAAKEGEATEARDVQAQKTVGQREQARPTK
jgi:outer membrane lipoprotein LolB